MNSRIGFLDLEFDTLTRDQVHEWLAQRTAKSAFSYLVTPNVDHMVRLATADTDVRAAYARAGLCLCDSRVLHLLARCFQVRLSLVPGSDLVAHLFRQLLRHGDRALVIGGSAAHAAELQHRFPSVTIVHHSPPMGLRHDRAARAAAVNFAGQSDARVILIAVGSPQQELLAMEMAQSGGVKGTALCVGASIDFLVGAQLRAPRVVQYVGMEWAWRLMLQPWRMARRYLVEGPRIFPLALRWWWRERRGA